MKQSQWLVSAQFDLAFFVAPPLVAIAVLWASPTSLFEQQELPVWAWVLLIPVIDVSHVYASLYAFCEEGLWDLLVWGDHPAVFGGRNHVLSLADSPLLPFVVGVLATPQATHYVLDGFIWKLNGDNPELGRLLNLDRDVSERPASLPLRRARASASLFVDPSPEAECS
jgi:hypothetical protein